MTREDIRVMAAETEVLVATMANVFITPPTSHPHLLSISPTLYTIDHVSHKQPQEHHLRWCTSTTGVLQL